MQNRVLVGYLASLTAFKYIVLAVSTMESAQSLSGVCPTVSNIFFLMLMQ